MEILKETLNWSYNIKTSKAHIITIKGHENSEKMAARCLESCQKVGQPAEIFQAFDGTGKINPSKHNTFKARNMLFSFALCTLGKMC